MNSELDFLDHLLLGVHLGLGEAVYLLLGVCWRWFPRPGLVFLGSLLSAAQRDVDLVDLYLGFPLLVLPLPQQRGLQSEEVLHHGVEEVQLELTAVGFS